MFWGLEDVKPAPRMAARILLGVSFGEPKASPELARKTSEIALLLNRS
jgi:hypothetical protein